MKFVNHVVKSKNGTILLREKLTVANEAVYHYHIIRKSAAPCWRNQYVRIMGLFIWIKHSYHSSKI